MDVAGQMASKRVTKPVQIPEFEEFGPFTIRSLTGADRLRLTAGGKTDPENMGVLLVALSLGDKDGNRIFGDSELEKCRALPGRVLDLIAIESRDFNYIDAEAYTRAKKA